MHAWACGLTAGEAVAIAARFPGLGLVLYPSNVAAAADLAVPPIAYVTTVTQAAAVAVLICAGVPFRAVIVNDERNGPGPSGSYLTPAEYGGAFAPIRTILRGRVPVHTMGLQPIGGWWRDTLRCRLFDDAYHARLPEADGRAFNPNKVRLREVHRVLRMPGPWILSPAPFRTCWDRALEPVSVPEWAALARHPHVRAVALWCAREVHLGGPRYQREHGLVDRHGSITVVGRAVLNAL